MTTKADLTAENEKLRVQITELESTSQPDLVEKYESHGAALPDQIAAWLTVSMGKRYDGDEILIQDVREDRVQYRFKQGVPNRPDGSFGILRVNGELVDPPVHTHEFHILVHGGKSVCTRCGKSNPQG